FAEQRRRKTPFDPILTDEDRIEGQSNHHGRRIDFGDGAEFSHYLKAGACGKSGKNGYVDSGPEHNEIKSAFVAFVKQNSLEEIRRHQEQCNVRYNDDCHDCGDRYLLLQKLSQLSRLSQVRPAGYSDLVPSRL